MALVTPSPKRSAIGGQRSASIVLLVAWAMPIAITLFYNKLTIGAWTAYGATEESTAFAWGYFAEHWVKVIGQLTRSGLVFVFPLAMTGLIVMVFLNWRLGLIVAG